MNLVSDIANQSKTSTVIISANASNYYNFIAQPLASLMCYYFSLKLKYFILFSLKITDSYQIHISQRN